MKSINREITYVIVPEYMPEFKDMVQDVVYISLNYNVSIHKCMCGCGSQVVLPINHSSGWQLEFRNGKMWFSPSIGNYQFPCKSHYMIQNNMVKMFEQ